MGVADLWFVALTLGVFAALAAYVRLCVALGAADPDAPMSEAGSPR